MKQVAKVPTNNGREVRFADESLELQVQVRRSLQGEALQGRLHPEGEEGARQAGQGHTGRMLRLALPLLTLFSACGSPSVPSTDAVEDSAVHLEGATVIPLVEGTALPTVRVRLDGSGEVPFLVDTGSTLSLIHLPAARELGLFVGPYSAGTILRGSGGGTLAYDSYAAVGELRAGDLVVAGARLPAIESEIMELQGIAGVLGQDLLARLVLLVDVERDQLHLLPGDTGPAGIAAYLGEARVAGGDWIQAPIELRPCPFLAITSEGEPVGEIEVDTGATHTSFSQQTVRALGLEPTGTTTSRGVDGGYECSTYDLEGFDLYGLRIGLQIKDTPLEYGLLGMDVLGELVFVLDGPGEQLWLHHRLEEGTPGER